MAVTGMGDDQGLHHHAVFFHQIGDAGVGVDDQFVGQAHVPAPVVLFHREELLAEGPMGVEHRHAGARIAVHHLFRGDDLDLVRVGVQTEIRSDAANFGVVVMEEFEGPLGTFGKRFAAHAGCFFLKSSRKTGKISPAP